MADDPLDGDSVHCRPSPEHGLTARVVPLQIKMQVDGSMTAELSVTACPQALLNTTWGLIDRGEYGVAIVVAHMACEVATERCLTAAFASKGLQNLEGVVLDLMNGRSLNNEGNRKLYKALTGDAVEQGAFWQKFKESAKRRNKLVHKGGRAGKDEADDSYKVASALVQHLETIRCRLEKSSLPG